MNQPLTVLPLPAAGAEDVLLDDAGSVWTGTEDGSIFRMTPDGDRIVRVAHTGGRPLGLEWLPDGRLLVADAHRGLLAVDLQGRVVPLVQQIDGRPMRFCNNAAVGAGGEIWFSDTSTRFGITQWKDDLVQHTCTGRLLCRRPDGAVEQHLDGLAFANGVALAPDGSFVCVAQTGLRDVVRLWLTGERAGERDLLVADLPGYPDNISTGTDGLIWVTIASPRDPVVEMLQHQAPLAVRRAATAIPEALQPKPKRTARVQAYDLDGRLVRDIDADATAFHMATGVREHQGQVWLGSLISPAVARVEA